MRIIGGEARGRTIFAPDGLDTRPTSDRVRESLFSIIAPHIPGAAVLDLFAGSGALGLEALSRGAERAVLNDMARSANKTILRNIAIVRAEDRARVMCLSWEAAITALRGEKFSLVFLDPPYRMHEIYERVPSVLLTNGQLAADALIIMEHDLRHEITVPEGFILLDQRKYGDTKVSLISEGPRE